MGSISANLVVEYAITVDELPTDTNSETSSVTKSPSPNVGRSPGTFDLAAARRSLTSLRRLWDWSNYNPLGEEAVMMPGSRLSFVIAGLFSFTAIKSQGEIGFPFHTHPQATTVAVTSLLIYCLASAAEHAVSAARPGLNSVYAVTSRLGMKGIFKKMQQKGCQIIVVVTLETKKTSCITTTKLILLTFSRTTRD